MSYTPPPPPNVNGDNKGDNNFAVIAHLGTLINLITGLGFIVPLVIMLTKGRDSQFVRTNAVESLNFQISIIIYAIVSAILVFVLIGFVLLFVVAILAFILPIVAAVKTSNGEAYRYPITLRMVK